MASDHNAHAHKEAGPPAVLIPALAPDGHLLELVRQVCADGLTQVIVVDDGNGEAAAALFEELEEIPACTVLHHDEVRGKGRALKTGMQFFRERFSGSAGVVTADCDGQHSPDDLRRIADALMQHPDDLILGERDFSGAEIPTKSRFGNELTRQVFRLLTGLNVRDTQTGLRGVPASRMELFCSLKGERFDYELNMLLACKQHQISLVQVPITTIYLDNNSSTHFNPLTDSIRVYGMFLKFASSSLISFGVDYGSFLLFLALFGPLMKSSMSVFLAGVVSRLLSSTVNYTLNRLAVFRRAGRFSTIRYYALCAVQMLISSTLVAVLNAVFRGGAPAFKILVDLLLFFGSFTIQREWVFGT